MAVFGDKIGKWSTNKSILYRIGLYSVFFVINITIAFSFIYLRGKSLIWRDDCVSDFFIKCAYRKSIFQETIQNIFSGKGMLIPFVNLNLTGDSNLTKFVGYEIFDVIFWIIPKQYFEIAFCIVQILRLWLAGLSFFVFCTRLKNDWKYSIIGSMVYVFCSYSITTALTQPIYLSLFYYFPMLQLGVEMQIRQKKKWILILFCALSFLCNVYLMYYCTCALVISCFFRLLFLTEKLGEKIKIGLSLVFDYFLGFLLSAFLTIPIIMEILSSSRIGSTSYLEINWIYDGVAQLKGVGNFFLWNAPAFGSYSYYGFLAISFIPVLYILINKKMVSLKWTVITILIFMNVPLIGKLFGLSTVNNRWSYCLAFAIGYAVVVALPQIMNNLSTKEKTNINLLAAIYCVFSISTLFLGEKIQVSVLNVLGLIFIMVLANVLWRYGIPKKMLFPDVMLVISILILFNASFWFTQKKVSGFIDRGDVIRQLESYIDVAATEIKDNEFWRMDKDDCTDELSCNLPYWFSYDGISSFNNMINPYAFEYYQISENPGIVQVNKTSDLDRRVTDELLAGVKYFASTIENTIVPYGFNKIQETQTYRLYENSWTLPIAYTYSESISYDSFLVMNVAQKQELLLKAIVLGKEIVGEECQSINLKSTEIAYEIDEMVGIDKRNTLWKITAENSNIVIRTKVPQNSEIYVEIEGCKSEGGRCYVGICCDTGEKNNAVIQGTQVVRATQQKDLAINLGTGITAGEHELVVSFSGKDNVSFNGIHLYARPVFEITNDVKKLTNSEVSDIRIATNTVGMNVNSVEDGWLCFSLPYSPGWRCYVDGARVPIERANVMYMAVRLDKGEHDIELKYFPYGMRIGLFISIGSILVVIGLFVLRRKKNEKRAK